MTHFPIAEALAADLAGAGVDPNEAQKALAYLRSRRSGKAFFDYLQAVVNNGQVVIRSRQTLDYYRVLQQACQRFSLAANAIAHHQDQIAPRCYGFNRGLPVGRGIADVAGPRPALSLGGPRAGAR